MSSTTSNPFDQFDAAPADVNPFDQFDAAPPATNAVPVAPTVALNHPVAGPTGDWTADIPVRLGSAGTNFLAQAASIPRGLAQGVDWVGQKAGVNIGADQALASVAPLGVQLFPDAQSAKDRAYAMTGATEYVPATMGGRMVQAALESAPYGVIGGAKAFIPNMVGAATGEGAAEMVPNHPAIARLVGYVAGAKAAAGVGNSVAKIAGTVTGMAPTTQLYQDYVNEGVPTNLAGDVTQNRGLQMAQSMAARLPGGADAMAKEAGAARTAWEDAVERNAAKLGPSTTMQEAGESLQNSAQSWLSQWKADSNSNWQDFRTKVPPDTPIRVGNFDQAIQGINQNFGSASNLAKALKPGLGEKLEEALRADISPNGTLPWQAVQAARTRIGEMLESGQPVGDTQQAAIKQLYRGLTNDMQAGAAATSPEAARAFNKATGYTAFGHNLIEDHLGKVLNAKSPEDAATYALAQAKRGGTRLAALNSPVTLPGRAAEDLGAATLRKAAEEGPAKFAARVNQLAPEAQDQLFGSNHEGVDRILNIARSMGSSQRLMGNNSGTASHEAAGVNRAISAVELGRAGHEMAGPWGRAAGMALGAFSPELVGKSAAAIGANPLLSRIYSTDFTPFAAPNVLSPNALIQLTMPDRRTLPGGVPANRLLSVPVGAASVATTPRQ